jgi:homoserine acetyltransferase
MSKKNKSSQFPKQQKSQVNTGQQTTANPPNPASAVSAGNAANSVPTNNASNDRATVKPEQMSVTAYAHIKKYLKTAGKTDIEKEDLNAVLRLSQHLRLFGLLSAVGYVNQSNAQEGKVRDRTVPVWGSLLGQMLGKEIDTKDSQQRRELMELVQQMANTQPAKYMANWRKSMMLSEQWNFWARAYAKDSPPAAVETAAPGG